MTVCNRPETDLRHRAMPTVNEQSPLAVIDASKWLKGTWKSNRMKTLQGWVWPRGKNGKRFREVLEPQFGKLIHRYTPRRIYSRSDSVDFGHVSYRVVWSNADTVFLVAGRGDEEEGLLLHFVSQDEYWIHAGKGIEYFARVRSA